MTEEVRTEVIRQINRLERMAPDSMEAGVLRTYLDWVIALPWGIFTEDNLDIMRAKEILDADHYGFKDVKERILDFISVCNLKMDGASPILCFIGPPGTGKTSLDNRLRDVWAENMFAYLLVVSKMKLKFVAIDAPMLAPCQDDLFKLFVKRDHLIL